MQQFQTPPWEHEQGHPIQDGHVRSQGTPLEEQLANHRRRSMVGCVGCGVPLEADMTFCDQCGYRYLPIAATEATSRLVHQATLPSAPENAVQRVRGAEVVGGILALMVAGVVCYGLWCLAIWLWSYAPLVTLGVALIVMGMFVSPIASLWIELWGRP